MRAIEAGRPQTTAQIMQEHWDSVYREKAADATSWYQRTPESSLRALSEIGASNASSVIDIGGGTSYLVDHLVARGFADITVIDIAAPALELAKTRLGRNSEVHWEVADVTAWRPDRFYDVWHDRAVFHFLTERDKRIAYREALGAGVTPGGYLIMATFAPDGPERCSGLPVQRYDAATLAAELGPVFSLQRGWREDHLTPAGARQAFQWCIFQRC